MRTISVALGAAVLYVAAATPEPVTYLSTSFGLGCSPNPEETTMAYRVEREIHLSSAYPGPIATRGF